MRRARQVACSDEVGSEAVNTLWGNMKERAGTLSVNFKMREGKDDLLSVHKVGPDAGDDGDADSWDDLLPTAGFGILDEDEAADGGDEARGVGRAGQRAKRHKLGGKAKALSDVRNQTPDTQWAFRLECEQVLLFASRVPTSPPAFSLLGPP